MPTSSVDCHRRNSGVDSSLTTPVSPTTKAQTSVTMPSRLCRSSHLSRVEREARTVPNSSFFMNGPYSTTPDTMATQNSRPMKPRNSSPGRLANRSTCSDSMMPMKEKRSCE